MYIDTIIVGGGPAGVTSSIYAKMAGKESVIIEKGVIGGKVNLIDRVINYPGYKDISGLELVANMYKQIKYLEIDVICDEVIDSKLNDNQKYLTTSLGESFTCNNLIIATGSTDKEFKLGNANISYCEVCDGILYQGKDVAVVGGGNSAFHAAIYLSHICRTVDMYIRKPFAKADKWLIERALKEENISIGYNKVLNEDEAKAYACIFAKIGQELTSNPFPDLELSNGFYKKEQPIHGVYVVGDCVDKELRQIVTACADGAEAISKF